MSGNFEGGHDGLTSTFQRKFLEIKFRGFLQIADGFRETAHRAVTTTSCVDSGRD